MLRSLYRLSHNLDRHLVQTSIREFISSNEWRMKGRLIDLGCGCSPYRDQILKNKDIDYIRVDLPPNSLYGFTVDIVWDGKTLPFPSQSIDTILMTEVLEHCYEPSAILKEISRVMRENGVLIATVPFLWPVHDAPHDFYRYTPYAIERLIDDCDMIPASIKPLGGWNKALAQLIGLWVMRAPHRKWIRVALRMLALPIYLILIKLGERPVGFDQGLMFTGLAFVASKKKI